MSASGVRDPRGRFQVKGRRITLTGAAVFAMLGIAAAGCARAQAKTPGPAPPLAVPDPPTRLVIPVSVEPPAPTPPVAEKPAPTPAPRPAGARPTPTPTPAAAPPPTPVETPPPVLQPPGSLAELEARARDRLASAQKDLARVSPNALGREARDQYDSAARFIRMAQDAIAVKNFVYAAYCADKAATLAGLLVK